MIDQYAITNPKTAPCEYCDQESHGRVMVQLHGGSLWVCASCFELIQNNRHKPYSKVMERYSMRSTGHHVSIKQARINAYMARVWR
jgi:ribosome-binding protein aMBF1 (putative translation factor)